VQEVLRLLPCALHQAVRADSREIARHRADRLRDRPLVVVEDHEHAPPERARIVQSLERDTRPEARIADHGDDVPRIRLVHGARHEPQAQADARPCVTGVEEVVLRLGRIGEAAHAARASQLLEAFAPSRQDLVRIRLVRDVPDQAVAPEIEDVVERGRELDDAEVRAEVPAGRAHAFQQEGAHLRAQAAERLERKPPEVFGALDLLQQAGTVGGRGSGVVAHGRSSRGLDRVAGAPFEGAPCT
jgi:hypothetical protein